MGRPIAGSGPSGRHSLRQGTVGRLVAALAAATLLQWVGALAIAPLLPLYLEEQHVSASGVGLVMAAFFVGSLFAQYPAGVVTAVRGHRPVLVGGLVLYAVGSVGMIASPSLWCDAAVRALQGAGAGAFEVAVLSAIAVTVPADLTGRAVSAVFTGQTVGTAIGPLVGGIVGERQMDLLFLAAGAAAVIAAVPVLILLRPPERQPARPPAAIRGSGPAGVPRVAVRDARSSTRRPWVSCPKTRGQATVQPTAARTSAARTSARRTSAARPRRRPWPPTGPARAGVTGLLLVAAVNGLAVGTYETCWSLLLADRNASTEMIGLSFTLFALPYLLCGLPGGWLADHRDRRWLVMGATLATGVTVASYSFLGSFWLIMIVCCVEAIALAVSFPSALSLLAQETGATGVGRAQGLFTTAQTASTSAAALAAGALYSVNVHLPFLLTAVAAVSVAGVLPLLWRQVQGVASTAPDQPYAVELAAAELVPAGLVLVASPAAVLAPPQPAPATLATPVGAVGGRGSGAVVAGTSAAGLASEVTAFEARRRQVPTRRRRVGPAGRYAGPMGGSDRGVLAAGGFARPEERR